MKKFVQILITFILLGSLTIQADPFQSWSWDSTTQYENSNPIDADDTLMYTLHCSNNTGPPYEAEQIFDMQSPPSLEDMAFIVGGVPGTYYCVATTTSSKYGSQSDWSNEVNFTVLPGDLGYVPLPPGNLTLQ